MNKFIVSTSPHIQTSYDTRKLMLNVLIALSPVVVSATIIFGFRALIVMGISVFSAMLFEHLWCMLMKKDTTIFDLSAAVTGLLLAMTIPVSVPYFIPVVGSFFAIIIAKSLFGGLGNNFINPALAGRAFLLASYATPMTSWVKPMSNPAIFETNFDAISGATPLQVIKHTGVISSSYLDLFLGNVGGSIGEVSALAILIGFLYLLYKKIIKPYITISYILSVGVLGTIFSYNGFFQGDFLFNILSGGVMLGGVFMLTDYTTSPTTKCGNIIAGIIAALITIFIRIKGGYPEGVCYSILIVNILAPQIDKIILPKRYGAVGGNKK